MSKNYPLVYIGMSVRNCQATLGAALKSIIAQTYPNWKLLLIDDGSTDDTVKVAQHFSHSQIKILADGKSLGLPCQLNRAIDLCEGKYLARMDGDDISYPERLERQISYLEGHSKVDLLGASALVFGKGGNPLGKRFGPGDHTKICSSPCSGFPIVHPTYIGRIEWFRRFRYREELLRCEDQDLLLRSYRHSCFANVPEILLGYREEQLDLKKILKSRRFLCQSFLAEFMHQKQPAFAIQSLFGQLARGMVDITAVFTGLNYKLVGHRAKPPTPAETEKWNQVYKLFS